MYPATVCNLFEDSVQISHNDLTFTLNPGEVDEPQVANQVLLGKIISRHRLGKSAIQGSLKLSWNAIKGWKWKEFEDGIIQFTFARREDALNVLTQRPWFVCGALLVIIPWPARLSPTEVKFDKTPIWVNIGRIPPLYWNLSNLKELCLNSHLGSRMQWCGILTHDESTCFKSPTVIKDVNEMRESCRQLPGKKRIVTKDETIAGKTQPGFVITQMPFVYLLAGFYENNVSEEIGTGGNISEIGETKEMLEENNQTSKLIEELTGTTPTVCRDKDIAQDQKGDIDTLYNNSILGSQAQYLDWPSKECWAQPKAREVQEHLHGPRKRKASDGFVFGPTLQPNSFPLSSNGNSNPTKVYNLEIDTPTPMLETKNSIPREEITTEVKLQENTLNFSPGSNEEPTPSRCRGKRRGSTRSSIGELGTPKEEEGPQRINPL
ncbi:hypothetical protein G4B88_030238 [Cannabis sativa]|uniref:DUF4283 domain-containing protein n=1 Tax=Cannabis sativa TaxID=3483 RepID=A0A7J6DNZ9_CANSA|nr:hypothetical protein G4B88_030238 [Cannabis sativa]